MMANNDALAEETAEALLQAITKSAPNASYVSLEQLASAYALVVGAKWGALPGGKTTIKTS